MLARKQNGDKASFWLHAWGTGSTGEGHGWLCACQVSKKGDGWYAFLLAKKGAEHTAEQELQVVKETALQGK